MFVRLLKAVESSGIKMHVIIVIEMMMVAAAVIVETVFGDDDTVITPIIVTVSFGVGFSTVIDETSKNFCCWMRMRLHCSRERERESAVRTFHCDACKTSNDDTSKLLNLNTSFYRRQRQQRWQRIHPS